MPTLTLLGRISAISLLVALSASPQAQPTAAPQPSDSGVASAAPANVPFTASIQAAAPAPTDEQKGDSVMVRQQYQAALEVYSKIGQPSATLWNKMGIAYQMLFDTKNAARCYKQALKLDPNHSGALNNLATLDDARKDYAAAERLYRQALRADPGSARILKNLGTNLSMQHRYSESSDAYAQALAIDPHIFDRHLDSTTVNPVSVQDRGIESYLRARSCARAGLNDCAIEHLRQAFDQGSATIKRVADDNDFEALRQTPEFQRLLADQQ